MEYSSPLDEESENTTSNTLNITDIATANSIEHLGTNPDHWLQALQNLEQTEDVARKRKILKHFFVKSGKVLDPITLRNNRNYAVLLGKEALFRAELDVEDARSMFEMALTLCQKSSVLYLMFAQFELDQGRKNKALKILHHGGVCIGDSPEITIAKLKVQQGCMKIDDILKLQRSSSPMLNITSGTIKETQSEATVSHTKKLPVQPECVLLNEGSTESLSRIPNSSLKVEDLYVTKSHKPISPLPNELRPQELEVNTASTAASQIEKKCFQTPPPSKIDNNFSLSLDFQSPVFKDTSLTLIKKGIPLSGLVRDNCTSSSSVGSGRDMLNKTTPSNRRENLQTLTQENSLKLPTSTCMIWSEKKHSLVSTGKLKDFQTNFPTKKAYRTQLPMRIPRRVLIQNESSNLGSAESLDLADVKPLEKSPMRVRTENLVESLSCASTQSTTLNNTNQMNDKENIMPRRSGDNAISQSAVSEKLSHSSAFHPHSNDKASGSPVQPQSTDKPSPQSNCDNRKQCYLDEKQNTDNLSPQSNCGNMGQNYSYDKQFAYNGSNHLSKSTNNICTESRPTISSGNRHDVHHMNHNVRHSNYHSKQILSSEKFENFSIQPIMEHPVHQDSTWIHPAHRIMQEKKILEINGKPYILLKLLGKGGSSKVYQVLDPVTCEISAVKQVNLIGCEPCVLKGYKNEIEFLKTLQGNRHIISLLDYEIREKHLYLVMECGSLDLSAFLKKQKADHVHLDVIQILAFWKNMLAAVETIHKHGIIHLDLKPANFMLVNYTLKLIDFGIANAIQVDATSVIKDTQFGTINYMAPETIKDMSNGTSSHAPMFRVGPKADVWSLGCILYCIMYGKTPFQHIHHHVKLFAITNEDHNIEFPDFPQKQLVDIVKSCLTRDTKKRPSVEFLLKHPLLN
ncbi:uncharacterized protein LOC120348591 [Styela clava]